MKINESLDWLLPQNKGRVIEKMKNKIFAISRNPKNKSHNIHKSNVWQAMQIDEHK